MSTRSFEKVAMAVVVVVVVVVAFVASVLVDAVAFSALVFLWQPMHCQ